MVADITGLPRSPRHAGDPNAKQINLGMVFGMGPGTMAQEMGLPYHEREGRNGKVWIDPGEEAQAVFARYHEAIPGVKKILENVGSVAKNRGFIITVMGRHIRFPGGQATYKAGGLLFQGTAADALKVKIIEVDDYLQAEGGGRLMLNVHDEFDHSVDPAHVERVNRLMQNVSSKKSGLWNEQLIPLYDSTGRLFLASEDPTPTNKKHLLQQQVEVQQ
jgi:DNA polymerase-1